MLYFFWFREVFFVVMHCPLIDHDDGVLGNEVAFIPIILGYKVICPKLVCGTPAKCFLSSILESTGEHLSKGPN